MSAAPSGSFNQSYSCFLALSLPQPSLFLKLPSTREHKSVNGFSILRDPGAVIRDGARIRTGVKFSSKASRQSRFSSRLD